MLFSWLGLGKGTGLGGWLYLEGHVITAVILLETCLGLGLGGDHYLSFSSRSHLCGSKGTGELLQIKPPASSGYYQCVCVLVGGGAGVVVEGC